MADSVQASAARWRPELRKRTARLQVTNSGEKVREQAIRMAVYVRPRYTDRFLSPNEQSAAAPRSRGIDQHDFRIVERGDPNQ